MKKNLTKKELENTLFEGDCLKAMSQFPDKSTVLHKDKKVNLISVTKGRIKRLGYLCCIKL